jgi:hypothetical protein
VYFFDREEPTKQSIHDVLAMFPLPPEERLRGVSFDELVLNLSEDQVAQLP